VAGARTRYGRSFCRGAIRQTFLGDASGHSLVFTRHSVERVDAIDPALYDMLHALQAEVTRVHLEPIGGQREAELVAMRRATTRRSWPHSRTN